MKTNFILTLFAFTKILLHFGGVKGMHITTVEVGIEDQQLLEVMGSSDDEFNFGTPWTD